MRAPCQPHHPTNRAPPTQSATIGVNLRTLPGDGPGEVLDYLTGVVGPR